MDEVFTVTKHS